MMMSKYTQLAQILKYATPSNKFCANTRQTQMVRYAISSKVFQIYTRQTQIC